MFYFLIRGVRVKIKRCQRGVGILSQAFQKSIERKSLYLSENAQEQRGRELSSALEDLDNARLSYSQKHYKGATILACQSLFHSARALLCSRGYEGKSLSCIIGGIDHLFADQGLIEIKWIMVLLRALTFKEDSHYLVEYSNSDAKYFMGNAVQFLHVVKDLLAKGDGF